MPQHSSYRRSWLPPGVAGNIQPEATTVICYTGQSMPAATKRPARAAAAVTALWLCVSAATLGAYLIGMFGWSRSDGVTTAFWSVDHHGRIILGRSRGWPCGEDNRWTEVKLRRTLYHHQVLGVTWKAQEFDASFDPDRTGDAAPAACGAARRSMVQIRTFTLSAIFLLLLIASLPMWQLTIAIRSQLVSKPTKRHGVAP